MAALGAWRVWNGSATACGSLFSGILIGFSFAVPFVIATIGGVVGLILVYTQVGETVDNTASIPVPGD